MYLGGSIQNFNFNDTISQNNLSLWLKYKKNSKYIFKFLNIKILVLGNIYTRLGGTNEIGVLFHNFKIKEHFKAFVNPKVIISKYYSKKFIY